MPDVLDVIVIGGGQSGLAVGYYLRRTDLSYVILDANPEAGGAWQHMWKSLRLFSPAQWSSLPGVVMQGGPDYYPSREETVSYLSDYESRYKLAAQRNVRVHEVRKSDIGFTLSTSAGTFQARAVINATGSFTRPAIPAFPGLDKFKGTILHSSQYKSPADFAGQRVAVVGEGNSGAQILAEISETSSTIWITQKEPSFLPDHVDGRFLFDAATQMYQAKIEGKKFQPPSLGQIVMVPPVAAARQRGVFDVSFRPFDHATEDSLVWADGRVEKVDVIILCTGFKPELQHVLNLGVVDADGKTATEETKSKLVEGMWFVGYGNWTGFASATLIGVGRSARTTVDEVVRYLAVGKTLDVSVKQ